MWVLFVPLLKGWGSKRYMLGKVVSEMGVYYRLVSVDGTEHVEWKDRCTVVMYGNDSGDKCKEKM
jgi:hypothetical protein